MPGQPSLPLAGDGLRDLRARERLRLPLAAGRNRAGSVQEACRLRVGDAPVAPGRVRRAGGV